MRVLLKGNGNMSETDTKKSMASVKELIEKGMDVKYDDILADVIKRDYNDSHREIAPLKPAEDSVIADTSELSFDESVELLYNIVKNKIGE